MVAHCRLRLAEQADKSANVQLGLLHQVVQDPQPRFVRQELEQDDQIVDNGCLQRF